MLCEHIGPALSLAATRDALPPGPRAPRAAQTLAMWASPFAFFERCRARYGERFTIHTTSRPPLVFVSGVEDMRGMLAAPADVLHPGEGTATVEPIVGEESFMCLDEDRHLDGRRAVLPPLHAKVVAEHARLMAELAGREVDSWPRGVPFALHPRLRALTLEIALRTIFRGSKDVVDHRLDALRDGVLAMLSVTASSVFPEPGLRHGPGRATWTRFLRNRAKVDELLYAIIADRGRSDLSVETVFDRLLGARNADGSRVSPRQVRDNLMSMILAGHETTAAQLAWAFQLLAHNPLALEKLHEELDAGAGEEYLTATIHEVLRHRPVFVFTIPRAVKRPIELGGWTYRQPAQLLGSIYLLHHDPALYHEPHEFQPERFLQSPPQAHAWLPWGGGRKRCPGLHVAVLEMKTVLRTALASMTVEPCARRIERASWRSVIVTPHAGSRVVLRPR